MRRRRHTNASRRRFLKTSLGATAATAAVTTLGACSNDASGNLSEPRLRENVKSISAERQQELIDVFFLLKDTQSPFDPSLSYYDQFVKFHQLSVLKGRLDLGYSIAHQSPSFLPWHRKLLMLFEDAVRSLVRPDFALPYWDWTDDSSLDVIFTDDFMGPYLGDEDENYALTTSAFAKNSFPINLTASQLTIDGSDLGANCPFPYITRGPKTIDLPTPDDVTALLQVTTYDSPPYDLNADIDESFRNYLLGIDPLQLHSVPHVWLGGQWDANIYSGIYESTTTTFVGTMSALDCSPNDPVFWLHHCNVDRIWAMWETLYGASYEPLTGENAGWNLDDTLYPFNLYEDSPLMNLEGLNNGSMLDFEALGYSYDDLSTP